MFYEGLQREKNYNNFEDEEPQYLELSLLDTPFRNRRNIETGDNHNAITHQNQTNHVRRIGNDRGASHYENKI